MVNACDMETLRRRLERAHLLMLAGRLSEDVAWRLVRRTAGLLDRAGGSVYEPTLEVIHSLVASLWSNTRQQDTLAQMRASLNQTTDRGRGY